MASPELPFGTWRVRGIPASYDMKKLCDIIPLSDGERILYSSLAPDHYTNASTGVGTITWNCVPKYLQHPGIADELRVKLDVLAPPGDDVFTDSGLDGAWADAKFIGLTPLNAESQQVENV